MRIARGRSGEFLWRWLAVWRGPLTLALPSVYDFPEATHHLAPGYSIG
jgi:hypothetical protein